MYLIKNRNRIGYKSSIWNPKLSMCFQGGGFENSTLQLDLGAFLAGVREHFHAHSLSCGCFLSSISE